MGDRETITNTCLIVPRLINRYPKLIKENMKNLIRLISGLTVLLCAAPPANAADAPGFEGHWKLNPARSQQAGEVLNIEKTESGTIRMGSPGAYFEFDLTDKEFPSFDGGTVAGKLVDSKTWELTQRLNGKLLATQRILLDADSLRVTTQAPKPDGSILEMTQKSVRESGGPGFFGRWRSTEISGVPAKVEILTPNNQRITLKNPDVQLSCEGAFDSREYPMLVAGSPTKLTLTFERLSPKSFKTIMKASGNPIYTDVFSLSDDGETLTDNGNKVGLNEPTKAVYERVDREQQGSTTSEKEVRELEEKLADAIQTNDYAAIANCFASDLINIAPDGTTQDREALLTEIKKTKMVQYKIREMKVRVYGDTSVVTSIATAKFHEKDGTIEERVANTDVLIRTNGNWKVVSSQTTQIQPPAEASPATLQGQSK